VSRGGASSLRFYAELGVGADYVAPVPGERSQEARGLLRRFVEVCNAVALAHNRDVLQHYLKPGNVMLGPCGEVLVPDWGPAKVVGRAETASASRA
jgi:hypothetical protein